MKQVLWLSTFCLAAASGTAMAEDTAAAQSLASYAHYELHDITADVKVHPKVMAKLTTELKLKLDEPLARWNQEGGQPGHNGTLAVEVSIVDMKFVSGGKRFWAGGFAGDSHAAGLVKLVDKDSGKVVHSQNFINHANGVAGAWCFGATDNGMLDHLAANMGAWVIAMHDGSAPPPAETFEPEEKKAAAN
jgi:hypothetical protein